MCLHKICKSKFEKDLGECAIAELHISIIYEKQSLSRHSNEGLMEESGEYEFIQLKFPKIS